MAYIERLLVQGIRSFGPDELDAAKLKFSAPLTVILGQNGCGKTTIIESLKYAACGDMPPNAHGANFVHDPKLCDRVEVRGTVKLLIRDIKGKQVCVTRSVQSTQKAKKPIFKTLDATITTKDQAGQDVSISGRCADIDAEMCNALGVSKPILNNVIFCHQEDTNWPLDEGSKLKLKFDQIFDTAKYNKCIDSIKVQRKTMEADLKVKKVTLSNLDERKKEASEKRDKLRDEEGRMNVIQDQIAEYENELVPIKARLGELLNREYDISRLITEREKKAATLEAIKKSIQEYRQGITTEFQGSLEDLREAISNFQTQFRQQESKLSGLEGELSRAETEEQRLTRQINSEQVRLGQLTRDLEQNNERIETRNRAVAELSDLLSLHSNTETEGDVVRSLGSVERAIRAVEAELETLREEGDKEDSVNQKRLDALREEKTKLEQSCQLKNQQIETNKRETKKVRSEVEEVNQSAEKLHRLQQDLKEVEEKIENHNKLLDLNQVELEIRSSETKRDKLEDDLTALDKEVRELQSMSKLQGELTIQRDAKTVKETEIRKLKHKTEDSLVHLLGSIPESGIKHRLQSCIEKLTHEIRSKQATISEKQRDLTTLEADRKHLREKQREKSQLLAQDEEALYDVCESRDYDTVLAEATAKLDSVQDEKGWLKASEFMYTRYIKKMKVNKPGCPLCHRDFQEEQESQELIVELEGKLHGLPRTIEAKERELEALQERQSKLQQLRPTFERIKHLKNEEIPALQSQLEAIEARLENTRQELSALQTDLISPQSDEAMAKSIQGDVALLDQHQNELRKLEKEVSRLEERMPKGGSGRTMEEATSQQDSLRRELQMLRKSLQSLQDKRNKHNQTLHSFQTRKNSIVEQQLKIKGGAQQKKQLEDKLGELQVQELMLLEELDALQEQIQPASEQLEAAIREKEQARLSHKRKLDTERAKHNKLSRQFEDIRKIQEAIDRYTKSGGTEQLSTTKQTISRLGEEKQVVLEQKKQLTEQMDEVKAHLTNQQVHQRELDDNLKLRQKKEEEKAINEEISKLNTKIGGLDIKQVVKEKEQLKKREESVLTKKSHTEGRQRELQENIQALKRELNKDWYKNVDKEYSDLLIEYQVRKLATEDLLHYSKALEWSVSHFHNQRMKHINSIIGDLWTQIYCGNDIDTIMIKNDEEAAADNRKRKTYNYRVVQVKNGHELDMRGRCSAGQKMLASLIIRMALAEIFSTKCGILTLDEPTTNLDRDNIDRLCSTLVELVSLRSSQKSNFQLIIITHDEEFIQKLTNLHKVDYYFSVSRNDKGKSQVTMTRCD